ncbi:hypothetical protein E2C01_012063 [Portunus trituberculatus]|uniref:Uncharacterized protein n=1 Tax=Portunus trituberculatus TaxID=210409 RepID=A0A5B7DD13_PORTR|nr:hypothetical protein [Portunus trituberculatus]
MDHLSLVGSQHIPLQPVDVQILKDIQVNEVLNHASEEIVHSHPGHVKPHTCQTVEATLIQTHLAQSGGTQFGRNTLEVHCLHVWIKPAKTPRARSFASSGKLEFSNKLGIEQSDRTWGKA